MYIYTYMYKQYNIYIYIYLTSARRPLRLEGRPGAGAPGAHAAGRPPMRQAPIVAGFRTVQAVIVIALLVFTQ